MRVRNKNESKKLVVDDCIGIRKILMGTDSSDGRAKIVLAGY